MLRSLGGKSVSSMLGLNIALKMHLIYVCVCVCVCVCECVRERERERESVIMQNTAYCSRNYFPRAAFCVHGDPHNAGCIQS